MKRETYDYTDNLQGFPSHRVDRSGTRNLFRSVRIQLFTIGGRIGLNLRQDRSKNPGIGLGYYRDRDSFGRIDLKCKTDPDGPIANSGRFGTSISAVNLCWIFFTPSSVLTSISNVSQSGIGFHWRTRTIPVSRQILPSYPEL